jgi:hypothetical protein
VVGFLTRYRHLRWHDVVALGLNTVSWAAAAVLSVLQFGDKTSAGHWLLALLVVVGAVGGVAESAVQSNVTRSASERRKRRLLAGALVEDAFGGAIRVMSKRPEETAGVLYLPDASNVLRPAFLRRKSGDVQDHLAWATWVGCTGHAWGARRQTWADVGRLEQGESRGISREMEAFRSGHQIDE